MTQIIMTKDSLLAHLREQVAVAEKFDADRLKAHKKAEAEFLKRFREACREAAKWSYEEAKEQGFVPTIREGAQNRYAAPSCPRVKAAEFRSAIRLVELSYQSKYTMSSDGVHGRLHRLVTWTPDPEPEFTC